jgi:hypothetical protein
MANDLRNGRGRRGDSGGRNNAANGKRLGELKKKRAAFDLERVDPEIMVFIVMLAVRAGGAIRFGLTRDGGALAVGVFIDGDSETVYLNKDDDEKEFWLSIVNVYDPEMTMEDLYGGK